MRPTLKQQQRFAGSGKLWAWRTGQGFSQQESADLAGCSLSMWSRAERGERVFSPTMKVAIARRLGVSVADLFEVEPLGDVDATG